MVRTERRQVTRMKVNGLAYVNLEPNNGGNILNISEGGLCFQSAAPVERTETIRLWFSYRSRRIEVNGGMEWRDEVGTRGISRVIEVGSELAWTDPTRKRGGVRFKNLGPESREQIRDWIRQSEPVIINEKPAHLIPSPGKLPSTAEKRLVTTAARSSAARLAALFRDLLSARLHTGFSSGLLAGVLVSASVVAAFSLLGHRSELGNSLIQLGEKLGGKPPSRAPSSAPQARSFDPQSAPQKALLVLPESKPTLEMPPTVGVPSIEVPRQERLPIPTATKPHGVKLETEDPVLHSQPVPRLVSANIPTMNTVASRPSASEVGMAPAPDSSASVVRTTAPEMESAISPRVHIESSKVEESNVEDIRMRSEKYLEVGKFKEKPWADKATGQLSQLGFPTAIIPKSHWRGKTYQVLVGPYGTDLEAEAAHKNLESLGFATRSLEKGARDFRLPGALLVGGTHLPSGYCVVSWESYIPDAIVKIEDERGRTVMVEGKWVKGDAKFDENEVVYQKNSDGSRTLMEIRFHGRKQALVFSRGSH